MATILTTDGLPAETIANVTLQEAIDHAGAIRAAVERGTRVEAPDGTLFAFEPAGGNHREPWTDGRGRYATADLPYPLVEVVDGCENAGCGHPAAWHDGDGCGVCPCALPPADDDGEPYTDEDEGSGR